MLDMNKPINYPFSDTEDSDDVLEDDHDSDEKEEVAKLEQFNEQPVISDYLKKKGERSRYALINKEYEILNIIPTNKIHSVAPIELKKKQFVFGIVTRERVFYLQAVDQVQMEKWVSHIKQIIEHPLSRNPSHHDDGQISRKPSTTTQVSVLTVASSASQPSPIVIEESAAIPIVKKSDTHVKFVEKSPSVVEVKVTSPLSKSWGSNPSVDSSDEECPMSPVSPETDTIACQGYLQKLKNIGGVKSWKKRWFVLRKGKLLYYKDQQEYEVRRILPLATVIDILDIDPILNKHKGDQHCIKLVLAKRSWILSSDSVGDQNIWLEALRRAHEECKA
ncbi:hypothetical protein HDV01_004184 [Terramyces sp. JEL0728]|nr:hypothetical protein HDV01_004184 [Terramyces sp. JEL0728]